jgi:hypothetical protein
MALRNGSRFPVGMTDVFPHGCCLVPDSISQAQDYDEKTKIRTPAVDKLTGTPVYQCRVVDLDAELEGRSRETVVKILTDHMPVPPTRTPFESVEFEHLTVTACSAAAQSIPVKNTASGSASDIPSPHDGSDDPAAARQAPGRSLTGALRRVSLLPVCGPARAGGGGVMLAIHWRPR